MATHSIILAWRILWMEEPGGLLSMGSHRVRQNWSDLALAFFLKINQTKSWFFEKGNNNEKPLIRLTLRKGREREGSD